MYSYTESRVEPNSTVTFNDAGESINIPTGVTDETRTKNDNDLDLSLFLSRPVAISSFDWTKDTVGTSFNPWYLFLSNPRVINRISNYKTLSGQLNLRFVVNGNSFMFGALICSYLPLAPTTESFRDMAFLTERSDMCYSMLPHFIIDATDTKQFEMALPFFWPKDKIDIATGIADGASHNDQLPGLGNIYMKELVGLKHANTVLTAEYIPITIYAWMTDVSLEGATQTNPVAIGPQSEVEQAEDGKLSKAASAVKDIASIVKDIPVIGPYAKATELAAGKAELIFKRLGFSNPTILNNMAAFAPKTGSMANIEVPYHGTKLSLDPRNELGISPVITGIEGKDELQINSIASRFAIVNKVAWSPLDPGISFLCKYNVTPRYYTPNGADSRFYMTPACGASLPFLYWTGTIRFRLQVFASAHHRGKLLIRYDPTGLLDELPEQNVCYTHIVDISETRDLVIDIPNYQSRTWLKSAYPGVDSISTLYTTTASLLTGSDNGVLGIYVLNNLTLPNVDASMLAQEVTIVVSQAAGEDFRVAVPQQNFTQYTCDIQPNSTIDLKVDVEDKVEETMGEDGYTPNDLVYIGESIDSLRCLCKRFNHSLTLGDIVDYPENYGFLTCDVPMYPLKYGRSADGIFTVGLDKWNYTTSTMLNYVTMAFGGHRGSIRWRVLTTGVASFQTGVVSRVYGAGFKKNMVSIPNSTPDRAKMFAEEYTPICEGADIITQGLKPYGEVEIPFYSDFRFIPGMISGNENLSFQKGEFIMYNTCLRLSVVMRARGPSTDNTLFSFLCASGEDFNVYFFIGWPLMRFTATD